MVEKGMGDQGMVDKGARLFYLVAAGAVVAMLGTAAHAAEQDTHRRHADSHQHGHADLAVAIEDGRLIIELESPAANLVGFEHAARSPEDKEAVRTAERTLREDTARLFSLDKGAQCVAEETALDHALTDSHGNNHHQHADHGSEAGHSDFRVAWSFACSDLARLERIEVNLFAAFPALDHLDVTVVGLDRQDYFELNAGQNVIDLTRN